MKIITITSRSITIELDNSKPYFSPSPFKIYLNGELLREENKNVFSIFGLNPYTSYKIKINNEEIEVTTNSESNLIKLSSFNPYKDGIHDDTCKIQAAILCAVENSTVYIEEGTYLITSLFMKSGVTLYLEKGAKLIASTNRNDYPVLPGELNTYSLGCYEGTETEQFASIINFINVNNSSLIGEGEIDCQAEKADWYINHRVKRIAWRGHGIYTNRSKNILVCGIYLHSTPAWAVHPFMSEELTFLNMKIVNEPKMPTTDGIDPDTCNNVVIKGCEFDVGDDCIAIKSGTLPLAKKYRLPCKNIVISNNLMNQGHGGVVFGSESSGGIENVNVNKCLFVATDRGLRIKTRRGRGHIGIINNISFTNIEMRKVKTPFVVNMYYNMGPSDGHSEYVYTTKELPFDERTPVIGKFKFSNMKCYDVEYACGVFLGLKESPIEEIEFNNVEFDCNPSCEEGFPVMIEHNIKMKNIGLYCLNVKSIKTNNVIFNNIKGDKIFIAKGDDE